MRRTTFALSLALGIFTASAASASHDDDPELSGGWTVDEEYTEAEVVAPPAEVRVSIRPPAPIIETRPVAPRPVGYVWVSGHWHYTGLRWIWVSGHYRRARRGYVYIPAYYDYSGPRVIYRAGYWRRSPVRRTVSYTKPRPRYVPHTHHSTPRHNHRRPTADHRRPTADHRGHTSHRRPEYNAQRNDRNWQHKAQRKPVERYPAPKANNGKGKGKGRGSSANPGHSNGRGRGHQAGHPGNRGRGHAKHGR